MEELWLLSLILDVTITVLLGVSPLSLSAELGRKVDKNESQHTKQEFGPGKTHNVKYPKAPKEV